MVYESENSASKPRLCGIAAPLPDNIGWRGPARCLLLELICFAEILFGLIIVSSMFTSSEVPGWNARSG
jgi:hypothetical protein